MITGETGRKDRANMRSYTAIIERCPDTGLFVGYVPGLPGAHSQGETIDELNANLAEVRAGADLDDLLRLGLGLGNLVGVSWALAGQPGELTWSERSKPLRIARPTALPQRSCG